MMLIEVLLASRAMLVLEHQNVKIQEERSIYALGSFNGLALYD